MNSPDNTMELPEQPDTPEQLETFFSGLGEDTDASISIYSQLDGNKLGYLFTIAPGQMSVTELLDHVRDEYGEGAYRAHGKEGGGKFKFNRSFFIGGGSKKSKAPQLPRTAGAAAVQSETSLILAAMQQQSADLRELIATLAQRPQEKSTLEFAQDLAAIKSLFVSDTPAPTANILETVKDFLAIKEQLVDSEEAPDPLTTAVKSLVPMISKAVENMQEQEKRRLALAHRPTVQPEEPAQMHGNPSPLEDTIKAYLPSGVMAARMGVEPSRAADVALENVPGEGVKAALVVFLSDEFAVERMAELYPPVAQHADWFAELADEMLDRLAPETPETLSGQEDEGINADTDATRTTEESGASASADSTTPPDDPHAPGAA